MQYTAKLLLESFINAKLCEIDLKRTSKLIETASCVGKICLIYISIVKQDFEDWLQEHKMTTLKEIFDLWACELLESKVTMILAKSPNSKMSGLVILAHCNIIFFSSSRN